MFVCNEKKNGRLWKKKIKYSNFDITIFCLIKRLYLLLLTKKLRLHCS